MERQEVPCAPHMNVNLTEEMAGFVAEEIASGDFANASEVVRNALRLMKRDRESEAERLALLKLELAAGLRQVERGEFSERGVAQRVIEKGPE